MGTMLQNSAAANYSIPEEVNFTHPYIVREIGAMDLQGIIKVYIFCDGSYPYSEDFKEVISKVDLVPMPGAMLQALRYILPQQDDVELDGLELTEAEINNELKAAEAVENSELQ